MQMKRILGILLALCFLMSVTAAAVSAGAAPAYDKGKISENGHNQIDEKDKKDKDQRDKDKFKQSGHWEIIKVKHVEWKHGEKHVYFTFKKVWIPAHHFNFR
jgi:Ni/Co efflux regulator RcnB